MDASITALLMASDTPGLPDACGEDPNYVCERVFEATDGNETAARLADWLIDRPLSIFLILLIAFILIRVSRRYVDRLVRRIVSPPTPSSRLLFIPGLQGGDNTLSDPEVREREDRMRLRKEARAASISEVLTSTISVAIWVIALMLVLSELGVDLAPLIAGAGIAGVALGFGAQALVKDCISGLFMLLEDQYGIGDVVDLGEATGTVEEVALRTTVLRGIDGTVWHVPNGEVQRVGNMSQHWSTALIDIDVAYDADLDAVSDVMQATADKVCDRDGISQFILDAPQVLGVETLGADGITLRMTVTTTPGSQWAVQRELRAALKVAFDAEAIEIPFPQRTLWLRNQDA
ncbi:mechanosensitive ion channel family protein [Ilumatobacter nonamiensis]|uniref:mechanosensitive ion channel family protein n=1 Tax=Ilumatobacter nonamiensis TaxID=467093 RepID=UPI0003462111|nr:mechanosensitive ion channel family protein [Ilumatobacter nonamiensis]